MASNGVLLKRSLKALGLTGQRFAEMLSTYREDGKSTAPATVSRWIQGTNPVEPAVLGWMETMLREKAISMSLPLLKMPGTGSIVILVASPKGGTGVSTIAQALAVIAAKDFRAYTLHLCVGKRGDSSFFIKSLERLRIESRVIEGSDMLSFKPAPGQVVIADVARDIVEDALYDGKHTILQSEIPDVILTAANFESAVETWPLEKLMTGLSTHCPIRILHRPVYGDLNAAHNAQKVGLDFTSELFIDQFIFQCRRSNFIPQDEFSTWSDDYQHENYRYLFSQLVDQIGGEAVDEDEAVAHIKCATLPELLDIFQV